MANITKEKLDYVEKLLQEAGNYTSSHCSDCRISHELIEAVLSCFRNPDKFDISVPVETIAKNAVANAEHKSDFCIFRRDV